MLQRGVPGSNGSQKVPAIESWSCGTGGYGGLIDEVASIFQLDTKKSLKNADASGEERGHQAHCTRP